MTNDPNKYNTLRRAIDLYYELQNTNTTHADRILRLAQILELYWYRGRDRAE